MKDFLVDEKPTRPGQELVDDRVGFLSREDEMKLNGTTAKPGAGVGALAVS
jgi:hypothetical protein